jgi:hypothetical protein
MAMCVSHAFEASKKTTAFQVIAAASLMIALKLHNAIKPIQDIVNAFAHSAIEMFKTPVFSRELNAAFGNMRARLLKDGPTSEDFKRSWRV